MGSLFTGTSTRGTPRRTRRRDRGQLWAWVLFVCGLVVFGWGCATQSKQQRGKQDNDKLGLDQYDRFLGDRRDARQSSRRDSWIDGQGPDSGHYARRRAPTGSPTEQCLQYQQTLAQKQCLLPLLSQGTAVKRKKHLKALMGKGLPGVKAVLVLLQQGDVKLRTFLMRSILQDTVFLQAHPVKLVSALYKVAKQDFLETLSVLNNGKKLQVASRLMEAMLYFTRKRATRELKPYLQLPAKMLWGRIKQETTLATSMALVTLSDCTKGVHQTPRTYMAAMQSLQRYYTMWHVWKYAARHSGVGQYYRALRAYRRGQLRHRPRPRIDRSAWRLAVVLAHKMESLKPGTEKAILSVRANIPRQRMKSWFSSLVAKSPKLSKRKRKPSNPQPRLKPNPRGKIEL